VRLWYHPPAYRSTRAGLTRVLAASFTLTLLLQRHWWDLCASTSIGIRLHSWGDYSGRLLIPATGDDPTGCTPFTASEFDDGTSFNNTILLFANAACAGTAQHATAAAVGARGFLSMFPIDDLYWGCGGQSALLWVPIRAVLKHHSG